MHIVTSNVILTQFCNKVNNATQICVNKEIRHYKHVMLAKADKLIYFFCYTYPAVFAERWDHYDQKSVYKSRGLSSGTHDDAQYNNM